ncbi:MAG: hypothetical protein IPJ30_12970 [Acidobacteria bacterium]|nr:hypothetical protein [Acidobacteriota bacterium]
MKDVRGSNRYDLFATTGIAGKSNKVIEFMVELEDKTLRDVNLLKPTNDPDQDALSVSDFPNWFYLGVGDPTVSEHPTMVLPFLKKRTIKVEGGFCSLWISEFQRNSVERNVVDSAVLEITFQTESCDCMIPGTDAVGQLLSRPAIGRRAAIPTTRSTFRTR